MKAHHRLVWAVLGLLCASPLAVGAQSPFYGVRVGLTSANLGFESSIFTPNYGPRLGQALSATVRFPLTEDLSIRSGLEIVGRGTGGESAQFVMRSTYLEVPVLFQAETTGSKRRGFVSGALGASLGIELHCGGRTVGPTPGGFRSSQGPLDCDGQRSDRTDAALLGSVGVGWETSDRRWHLEAMYAHGLTDIGSEWTQTSIFNRVWTFSVSTEWMGRSTSR